MDTPRVLRMAVLLVAAHMASNTSAAQASSAGKRRQGPPPPSAPARSATDSIRVPDGPSMAETKAWLENEMPKLTSRSDTRVSMSAVLGRVENTSHEHATAVLVDTCTLFYVTESDLVGSSGGPIRFEHIVPLGALDIGSIAIGDAWLLPGQTRTSPALELTFRTRSAAGARIVQLDLATMRKVPVEKDHLPVDSRSSGERIQRALARAAQLCGSPASPF